MKDFIEELRNWWWYNKRFVFVGLVILAIFVYMFAQSANEEEPDYFVGMVSIEPRSTEQLAAIEKQLTAAGEDINGDGKVVLQLKCYSLDLTKQYSDSEKIIAFDSDILAGISGIFLMDDPQAFQEKTGRLLAEPIIELEPGLHMGLRFDAENAYATLFNNFK